MESDTVSLPRFIVLKSQNNDKYLIHIRDEKNRLQFSGIEVDNLHVKFEVVSSTEGPELVHLKSCYNNKYWVIHPNQSVVSADAFEKEEDQSKPLCTLFKRKFFTSNKLGFYHVYHKSYVTFPHSSPFYLEVGNVDDTPLKVPGTNDHYIDFWNWELLPILPKFMALKSNTGLYLNAFTGDTRLQVSWLGGLILAQPIIGGPLLLNDELRKKVLAPGYVYLRFNCNDKGQQGVVNQVFTNPDRTGTVRIKNIHSNGFWRRSPDWIWPDSLDETNNNKDTLFEVIKLPHNKIALKNLGNRKFITSLSVDGKNDCLNASSTTMPETAKFDVEELVTNRQIYNVHFHSEDSREYKKEILHSVKWSDDNNSSVAQEGSIEFDYTLEESQEWTTSSSVKLSAETQITFGPPKVVQGKVTLAAEVTKVVTNGKTSSVSLTKKYARKVNVPPRSKVVVDFLVTQAICDIPYSYSQHEILSNGLTVTSDRDDGLYTSIETEIKVSTNEVSI